MIRPASHVAETLERSRSAQDEPVEPEPSGVAPGEHQEHSRGRKWFGGIGCLVRRQGSQRERPDLRLRRCQGAPGGGPFSTANQPTEVIHESPRPFGSDPRRSPQLALRYCEVLPRDSCEAKPSFFESRYCRSWVSCRGRLAGLPLWRRETLVSNSSARLG